MEQFVPLRTTCPKCDGVLEREILAGKTMRDCPIRCSKCARRWQTYKDLCDERRDADATKPKMPTLDKIRAALMIGKVGVRGARNVAHRARTAGDYLRDIADEVGGFEGQASVARIGEHVESIVNQLIMAVEDLQDAKKGNMGEEPPEEEE